MRSFGQELTAAGGTEEGLRCQPDSGSRHRAQMRKSLRFPVFQIPCGQLVGWCPAVEGLCETGCVAECFRCSRRGVGADGSRGVAQEDDVVGDHPGRWEVEYRLQEHIRQSHECGELPGGSVSFAKVVISVVVSGVNSAGGRK